MPTTVMSVMMRKISKVVPLVVANWKIRVGIAATIPPKMMMETPLPMPCSEMSSPSQSANMVPAVSVTMIDHVEMNCGEVGLINASALKPGNTGGCVLAMMDA